MKRRSRCLCHTVGTVLLGLGGCTPKPDPGGGCEPPDCHIDPGPANDPGPPLPPEPKPAPPPIEANPGPLPLGPTP